MNYANLVMADRRLMILRVLVQTAGYGANRTLIKTVLDDGGHRVSSEKVDADIAWLTEHGLVGAAGDAVRITLRGHDVATGREVIRGVRRPLPGEDDAAPLEG